MRQASRRFSELDLRTALIARLEDVAPPDSQLIEEFGIERGRARIDVAVVDRDLMGYEIKSDYDTLDRLARQMHAYHRVFDSLTLVTTAQYCEHAEQLLPTWWGIWQAEDKGTDAVVFTEVRSAGANPRQESHSLLSLLWREEAMALAQIHSPGRVRSHANRATLYDHLATLADTTTVRDWVAEALRKRQAWCDRSPRSDELVKSAEPTAALFEPCDGWQHLAATS